MATKCTTINDRLEQAFATYRDRPAYTCAGHTLTFGEIDRLSHRFASFLQHHTDLQPGDRIALQMPNMLQYPVALYGAIRAGLVVVNANPLYKPKEIRHQLRDSGAKALVVLSNVASEAAQIIGQTSVKTVIVTDFADLLPWPKRPLINFVIRHVKKLVPAFHFPHQLSFRRALSLGNQPLKSVTVSEDSLLALQYTGGTTGVAKGAMLTHKNLCTNVDQVVAHMPELFGNQQEIFAAPLPLYHIYAINLNAFAAFFYGSHNILIPNPRDIASLVKALSPHKFTVFLGVNTLFNVLLRDPSFCRLDFSALKITAAGAMAATEETMRRWEQVTGCKVTEGYGLTETSPVVSLNPAGAIKPGTIGTPLPDTEVKVVDEEGNSLGIDVPGELCVRGPQVMKGYWQRPEENSQTFLAGGWFKTGDVAIIHDDGYIKLVDRKKDMIIVSGFNVYPNEVEEVLSHHPAIVEAAVVGLPSDKTGEMVKAFVVASDPHLTEEEVIDFCYKELTAYKVPRVVEFRESLPKSNVGKILRRELRDAPSAMTTA